jgi:hypothetical protein
VSYPLSVLRVTTGCWQKSPGESFWPNKLSELSHHAWWERGNVTLGSAHTSLYKERQCGGKLAKFEASLWKKIIHLTTPVKPSSELNLTVLLYPPPTPDNSFLPNSLSFHTCPSGEVGHCSLLSPVQPPSKAN